MSKLPFKLWWKRRVQKGRKSKGQINAKAKAKGKACAKPKAKGKAAAKTLMKRHSAHLQLKDYHVQPPTDADFKAGENVYTSRHWHAARKFASGGVGQGGEDSKAYAKTKSGSWFVGRSFPLCEEKAY